MTANNTDDLKELFKQFNPETIEMCLNSPMIKMGMEVSEVDMGVVKETSNDIQTR